MSVSAFDLTEPKGWRARAACAGTSTSSFFEPGDVPGWQERALAVCSMCPVVDECLAFALETRQEFGIWGGLTAEQRRRLRRHQESVWVKRVGKAGDAQWMEDELALLRRLAHLGSDAIAAVLGRSKRAVERRAQRERISLRRPGERRGNVMGDRGDSEREADLRAALSAGKVTMTDLEDRVRASSGELLCPACGRRSVEMRNTGLCRPCHAKRVLEAYEDVSQGRAAGRALDAARARAYRRRKRR